MSKNNNKSTVTDLGSDTKNETTNPPDALANNKEFICSIRRGEAHCWNNNQITGDVDLRGETIAKPVIIQNAVFTGVVDLSQTRFEREVDLSGCRFNKLILSDARVEGPLILDNVVIGAETDQTLNVEMIRKIVARLKEGCRRARSRRTNPPEERDRKRKLLKRRWTSRHQWQERLKAAQAERTRRQTVANLDNLRLAGCLSMIKAHVHGNISCNYSEIEDDFRIDEAQVYGNLSLRHTSLGEFRTNANPADTSNKNVEYKPCHIDGILDFTSATISGDLRLIGVTIDDELTLQSTDITGSLLCRPNERVRTRLMNGAWLMLLSVKGNVDFSGARLHSGINLGIGNIRGNLQCSSRGKWVFTMDGDYAMPNVRVGANINSDGCLIRGNIDLSGAKIENDVTFEGAYLGGDFFLQQASIGNNLLLRAVSISGKRIRCTIDKKAWLLGVTVAGDVDISGVLIGGDLIMESARIGQNVLAKIREGFQSQINGKTLINGTRIHGTVELGGVLLREELNLDGALIEGGLVVACHLNDANDWQIVDPKVGGKILARAATINKRVIFMGLTVGSSGRGADATTAEERGINFLGAQVNGEFSLYSVGIIKEFIETINDQYQPKPLSWKTACERLEQARRKRTVIQGDLLLTRAQVSGDILLDGVRVEGELNLRDANVRADIICKPIELGSDEPITRASVHLADFETLDMTGDMNLTGLTISAKSKRKGNLILRDIRIRGRLELCPDMDQPDSMEKLQYKDRLAKIQGKLQMSAAEISHVIISGKNLMDGAEEGIRVRLERAKFGRLQVLDPIPVAMDLTNLKVDRLDRLEDQSMYETMLMNSYPFKKSNYLGIENALRNAGLSEQADKVHVLMRRQDRPEPASFGPWLLDIFLYISIKYGTTSKRLVLIMFILFAVSVWIFSNYNHVEYDISPQADKPQVIKHPENWSKGDAILLAARLHVPIISLGVEEKVQPSGILLKAYAMAVVALSWIMWPLLIASASGFIRKQA